MKANFFGRSRLAAMLSAALTLASLMLAAMLLAALPARAFLEIGTKAPYALLMEVETGAILFEKNADTLMEPASMTKIVTLTLLFEEIRKGRVSLDDKIYISRNAWERGGPPSGSSTMFLEPESLVSVGDLIMGVAVQSGNDATIAIAEHLAGTEEDFARAMTRHARALNLKRSLFLNASGWPQSGHETTAREIAQLALYQIRNYPKLYGFYGNKEFVWNGISQRNRNNLLSLNLGVDGIKTGHSKSAGYGIVVSAERQGRRLLLVVSGLPSERARTAEAKRLLEWGFKAFRPYRLFEPGDSVEPAVVWHGRRPRVPLTVDEPLAVTITDKMRSEMRVRISYTTPLIAPLERGQKVGKIEVLDGEGRILAQTHLVTGREVVQEGLFGRAFNTLEHLLFGG